VAVQQVGWKRGADRTEREMESSIRDGIFDILAYHKVVQFVSNRMSLVKYHIIVQNVHVQTKNKSENSKDSSYEKSDRYSITSLTQENVTF
jgi:hypothetical protein